MARSRPGGLCQADPKRYIIAYIYQRYYKG
jgi:hypothetical protein